MRSARCKSCGAEIVWALTDQDKKMPVDAAPADDGNITLNWLPSLNEYRAIVVGARTPNAHGPRYKSHFATCPDRDKHRKAT